MLNPGRKLGAVAMMFRAKHEQTARTIRCAGQISLWAVVTLGAAGLSGLGLLVFSASDDPADRSAGDFHTIERTDFDITVLATGQLEAAQQLEVRNEVNSWETKIVEIVEEGVEVKKDQVVARLMDDQIKQRHDETALSLQSARAEAVAAQRTLEIKKIESESNRKEAEAALELARLELDRWRHGDDVQKREELKIALDEARQQLSKSQRNAESGKKLFEDKFISRNDYEQNQLDLRKAESALATAELNMKVYEQYTRPHDHRKFSSALDKAETALNKTIQESANDLARAESALDSKQKRLALQEQRLEVLKKYLDAMELKAPQDGIAIYASSLESGRHYGEGPIAAGRRVRPNEPVVYIPDLSKMVAVLKVPETMVAHVKMGDRVTIRVDALEGVVLNAVIEKVDEAASIDYGWGGDIRKYRVRAVIEDLQGRRLKPSMGCSGTIVTDQVAEALATPVQTVYTEGDQRFCFVLTGAGKVRRKPVEIGRASETMVEILSGLNEGDRVLLRDPKPGELDKDAVASAATPTN